MTVEKLLRCSAAQLAEMSDSQLLEYFKPYLDNTRPQVQSVKVVRKITLSKTKLSKQDVLKQQILAEAMKYGVTPPTF